MTRVGIPLRVLVRAMVATAPHVVCVRKSHSEFVTGFSCGTTRTRRVEERPPTGPPQQRDRVRVEQHARNT